MSGTHMEPLAMWGKNSHSFSTEKIIVPSDSDRGSISDYAVFEIPRTMFRQAASMFSDVRHADSQACYDEMALQLFLNMLYFWQYQGCGDESVICQPQIPHAPNKTLFPYDSLHNRLGTVWPFV